VLGKKELRGAKIYATSLASILPETEGLRVGDYGMVQRLKVLCNRDLKKIFLVLNLTRARILDPGFLDLTKSQMIGGACALTADSLEALFALLSGDLYKEQQKVAKNYTKDPTRFLLQKSSELRGRGFFSKTLGKVHNLEIFDSGWRLVFFTVIRFSQNTDPFVCDIMCYAPKEWTVKNGYAQLKDVFNVPVKALQELEAKNRKAIFKDLANIADPAEDIFPQDVYTGLVRASSPFHLGSYDIPETLDPKSIRAEDFKVGDKGHQESKKIEKSKKKKRNTFLDPDSSLSEEEENGSGKRRRNSEGSLPSPVKMKKTAKKNA
jgi:hypothetical protein